MNYKVAKTIGLNTDQKASQVCFSFCDEENVFLGVLTLESDDAFVSGRQLLSDLSDFFCQDDAPAGEKLTASFSQAKEKLAGKVYSLLLAAVSTKVLYLIGAGDVSVVLKREENLSALLERGTEQLISGFLQEGDKVLLSTQAFGAFLGDNLGSSLKLSLEEWEDEMSIRLNEEGAESGLLAGLLVEVEQPSATKDSSDFSTPEQEDQEIAQLPSSTSEETTVKNPILLTALSGLKNVLGSLNRFLPKSGRFRLIAALVIIAIILVGVSVKFFGAKSDQDNKKVTQLIQQAKSAETEAQGLKGLNASEAQKKLQEAQSLVDQALKIKPKDKAALDLKKELADSSSSILQKSSADLAEWTDLSSTQSDFKGSRMSLSAGKLLILDSFGGSLVSVDTDDKTAQVLAKKADLGKGQEVVLDDETAYLYSSDKGIVKVDLGNKKSSVAVKLDDSVGSVQGIGTFGSNLYLLDSSKNQIWKYLPTSNGFSNARAYLTADTKVDLKRAVSLQIDSSVYVLKQDGAILKFTKGTKDDFTISGLDKPLKDPKAIFASADTEQLYVLDSGNNRVVVLNKSGEYKAQYQSDKLALVSSLAVDEKDKKIYLVEGSKVYTMDLK